MSESSFFPWMSATQAAERLGFTGAYIRKLVAEGRFPRPIRVFPGVQIFSAADVDTWARDHGIQPDTTAFGPHTGQATLAIQADSTLNQRGTPLRLATDVVRTWDLPHAWRSQGPDTVHVRIYRASDRIVVLLGEPAREGRGRIIRSLAAGIVECLTRELLTEQEAEQAYWIEIAPAERYADTLYEISNIILDHDRATHTWDNPTWVPLSIADLTTLLRGAHVDWYDPEHYTPDLVARWQRDARPVEVIHDAKSYRPALAALEALDSPHARQRLGASVVDAGRGALLTLLALQHSTRGFDAEAPELVNTSVRVALELPAKIVAILPGIEQAAAQDFDQAQHRYQQLQEALYLVDRHAEQPDAPLAEAVEYAARAQLSTLRLIDAERSFRQLWLPTGFPRQIDIDGPWAQAYLQRCTWDDQDSPQLDPIEAHHRNAISWAPQDHPHTYGRDPFGNLVAHYQLTDIEGRTLDSLGIWWPTTYPGATPLPPDTHLVADTGSGDRAVWLMRRGELVGLLPRTQEHNQWNFGYSGSGPGTLADAIAEFMAATGRPVDHWSLEQQVCDRRMEANGLDITLDTIPAPRPE